ncbi:hypothetical protein NDU88_003921 [Pleurodeles waltl]|uniref:Uncharacterized protein n=1 Tax=Pleurodeles waltl TaxID=8319 RepID=A0AAV7QG89_PLEWA|nr:hypothetical protein NDU88_003921 [Pleurodeles waltl]
MHQSSPHSGGDASELRCDGVQVQELAVLTSKQCTDSDESSACDAEFIIVVEDVLDWEAGALHQRECCSTGSKSNVLVCAGFIQATVEMHQFSLRNNRDAVVLLEQHKKLYLQGSRTGVCPCIVQDLKEWVEEHLAVSAPGYVRMLRAGGAQC